MFITYIIQWWDDDNKAHMLNIGSLDIYLSEILLRDKGQALTICSHRLYINVRLSSKDYKDFFEVIYQNGEISKIVFKMGESEKVRIRHEYESMGGKVSPGGKASLGGKAGYKIATTKIMLGNVPTDY